MDQSQTVGDYARIFLQRLGIDTPVMVNWDSANDIYLIQLEVADPGILIGRRGETLSALQLVLAQHLKEQTGEWLNLSVNINDYRQRREQAIHALVDAAVSRVVAAGKSYALAPMSAGERRIVHVYLADHPQVTTTSMGEGRSRCVVISSRPQV